MIKKTITFEDFDGNTRTEDHWFHLTEAELSELELENYGGFNGLIRRMIETTDTPELTKLFKQLVLKSYGVKSADGGAFVKRGGELAKEFVDTAAFNALWTELIADPDKLNAFFVGILPKKLQANINSPEVKAKIDNLKQEYHLNEKK